MGTTWDDGPPVEPWQIEELMRRMGLGQTSFAEAIEVSQQHVNRLVKGKSPVVPGSTRVLLRWLLAVYGIEGGRAPTPGIPVTQAPLVKG